MWSFLDNFGSFRLLTLPRMRSWNDFSPPPFFPSVLTAAMSLYNQLLAGKNVVLHRTGCRRDYTAEGLLGLVVHDLGASSSVATSIIRCYVFQGRQAWLLSSQGGNPSVGLCVFVGAHQWSLFQSSDVVCFLINVSFLMTLASSENALLGT